MIARLRRNSHALIGQNKNKDLKYIFFTIILNCHQSLDIIQAHEFFNTLFNQIVYMTGVLYTLGAAQPEPALCPGTVQKEWCCLVLEIVQHPSTCGGQPLSQWAEDLQATQDTGYGRG